MTLQLISQLSKTQEVAQFIDDDQFGFGQSAEKCGYEAVALFWHSVQVGKVNPYHANDIHTMASEDYQRFAGPDVGSNPNGMSVAQLYSLLSFHRFAYRPLPLQLDFIFAWLSYGYPVILAVTEDSVYDLSLKAKPYAWNTSGLSHIILATGRAGGGNLLCRDTASIQAPGVARPGPRQYQAAKLSLLSATMVVPGWLEVPSANFDPRGNGGTTVQQPPIVTHPVDLSFQATPNEKQLWELGHSGAIFNDQWAIVKSWIEHFRSGHWLGVPLEAEQNATEQGVLFKEQAFSGGFAKWNSKTGEVSWAGPNGNI